MKSKNTVTVLFVIAVAIGALGFTIQRQSAKQNVTSNSIIAAAPEGRIPTEILYDQMFRLIISIRAKAGIQKAHGERITLMRTYFKEEARLSDVENEILENTAIQYITEVREIDDQAEAIVSALRLRFQDGEVPRGQEVPAPPEELGKLQKQRDELAMKFREDLSTTLGAVKFAELDEFIHRGFAAGFQSISPSTRQ